MGQPLDHFGPGRVAKLQLLDHIFGESRKQHEPPIVEGPREEPRVERIDRVAATSASAASASATQRTP